MEISKNEKKAMKIIFTDFMTDYNAYNIKEKLGVSDVGSLKLLKRLEEKNLLNSKKMGNATFYKVNIENDYSIKLLELTMMEYDYPSYVKGWIHDLMIFKDLVNATFLFGSVLKKGKKAADIDVCFILENASDYKNVQEKIDEVNKKSRLKIHPLYLTEKDFEEKLKENDKPVIDMVRSCAVVHGVEIFVKVLKNVQS